MSTAHGPAPRMVTANRNQMLMLPVDVENLIPADHPARAIWEFVGELDLSSYELKIKSVEGNAGRPAYDPRLLVSVWIYALTDGEGSAREIEKLCGHDPAYQWLTGMEVIGHHTLSDFRVDHGAELDELFTQIIGVLSAENLITLKRTTVDGTKIKASASGKSFRREKTLQDHLDEAREQIASLGDPRGKVNGGRREKARERALKDRESRLKKALEELPKIRAQKKNNEARREARVSETDPEARNMQHGNRAYAPSYNLQVTTDSEEGLIVNVGISQEATDHDELTGAMEEVEARTGRKPQQVVADGAYTNRANILSMEEAEIDFIGSFPDKSGMAEAQYKRRGITKDFRKEEFRYNESTDKYICPAGQELKYISTDRRKPGMTLKLYRAEADICAACPSRAECHPKMEKNGRSIMIAAEDPAISAFHEKMSTDEAKKAYATRSATAEFPNLWIKEKIGLRRFRTRGIGKVKQEALWAGITYNIQQWIRLIWRPRLAQTTG